MAGTTIYTINSTDGTEEFVIHPRTFDGPDGVQETTDLTLYGNAAPNWGERFNENFYHLLENFACPQDVGTTPQNISNPITGQLWFNKTDGLLYVYNGTAWNSVGTTPDVSSVSGLQAELDAKVDRAGDANLSGTHSWPSLSLNEGNGNVTIGPDIRMSQSGLISADESLSIHVDGNNTGAGELVISRGSTAVDGSQVNLFRIQNNGTLHSMVSNYETLVTDDDDIPNKKYVDDEVLSAVGAGSANFVEKAGDTMTDTLFFTLPNETPGIYVSANSGPYIELHSDAPGAPPAIVFYNFENDIVNRRPYTRLVSRDATILSLEIDTVTGPVDANAEQVDFFTIYQTGRFDFLGGSGYAGQIPVAAPEHVIRCNNAAISEVGSHNKNLATVEYVDNAVVTNNATTESGEYAIGTAIDYGHALGAVPSLYTVVLRCKTAELGYQPGDEIDVTSKDDSPGQTAISSYANALFVGFRANSTTAIRVITKDTVIPSPITAANWRIVFRVWS